MEIKGLYARNNPQTLYRKRNHQYSPFHPVTNQTKQYVLAGFCVITTKETIQDTPCSGLVMRVLVWLMQC